MFRDAKEELKRLEAELLEAEKQDKQDALLEAFLAEEEEEDDFLGDFWEEDPLPPKNTVYHNFSNNYGRDIPDVDIYNSDDCDEDLNDYSEDVRKGRSSNRGLLITALMLLLGIAGVLVFWVLRYLT